MDGSVMYDNAACMYIKASAPFQASFSSFVRFTKARQYKSTIMKRTNKGFST